MNEKQFKIIENRTERVRAIEIDKNPKVIDDSACISLQNDRKKIIFKNFYSIKCFVRYLTKFFIVRKH